MAYNELNGVVLNATNPAFLAYNTAQLSNVTGDGTAYTVIWNGTLFDQTSNFNTGTGVFTAPVTGIYCFSCEVTAGTFGVLHTSGSLQLVTTGVTYTNISLNPYAMSNGGNTGMNFTNLVKMTAGDTASVLFTVTGSTKTINVLFSSSSNLLSSFGGYLVC